MTKNGFIIICILISAIGSISIYIVNHYAEVPLISLSDVDHSLSGLYARVCGKVDGYSWVGESIKIVVTDENSSLPVLIYPSDFGGIDVEALMSGDVCSEGRIVIYKGLPEMIGKEIKKRK